MVLARKPIFAYARTRLMEPKKLDYEIQRRAPHWQADLVAVVEKIGDGAVGAGADHRGDRKDHKLVIP